MKYLYKLKLGKTTNRISVREWRPILGYIDRLNKLKMLKTKKIKKKEGISYLAKFLKKPIVDINDEFIREMNLLKKENNSLKEKVYRLEKLLETTKENIYLDNAVMNKIQNKV